MFARALWGNQRKHTTAWDTKYPGKFDSAAGPCVGGRNSHCGAGFVPDANDQAPIDRYIVYHTLHDSRATRFRGTNHPSQPRHYLYICLQAPYLPDGHAACGTGAGSEGVFSGPKSGIPWCVSPTLCAMHTQYPLSRIPCRHPSPPAGLSSGVVACATPCTRRASGEGTSAPSSTERSLASTSGTLVNTRS